MATIGPQPATRLDCVIFDYRTFRPAHRLDIGPRRECGPSYGGDSGGALREAHADTRAAAGLAPDIPVTADGAGALTHAGETKPLLRRELRTMLHAGTVIGHGEFPVPGLIGHGDAHGLRPRMAHRIADRFLRNAQQLVLMLGLQSGLDATAFEGATHATGYGGALGELPQRELQSRAARLVEPQRHHRAARFGKTVASELPDARERDRQLRAALAAGGEFLHRTELQQDAGEGLGEAVVDLLADAGALHEHRGVLGGVSEAGELHG